jgi:hypothetical protein
MVSVAVMVNQRARMRLRAADSRVGMLRN